MDEFTRGVEAEVNGIHGFALGVDGLGVEVLEERIAPTLLGISLGVSGGCGCHCGSSSSS